LIIFALGFRFFYSVFNSHWEFLFQGLIGFGIFFAIGNLLYYGRFFAGGDAKLMIALGVVLPLSFSFLENITYFAFFFLFFLFVGAVYGVVLGSVLISSNYKNFKIEFFNQYRKRNKEIKIEFFFSIILIMLGFFYSIFLYFGLLFLFLPYLFISAKAVEECCFIKSIKSTLLTGGDWLYKDVKIGKKTIVAKWDGLSNDEINFLKKHKKNVLIKQGIPFVPVFWISFLVWIFYFFFWK
jgi:hypothetical protein